MSSTVFLNPVPDGRSVPEEVSVEVVRAPDGHNFEVRVIVHDGEAATVQLTGELDLATNDLLAAVLTEQSRRGHRFLRIDVSGLTFCDCAGLRVLVHAHNRQLACRGTLVLTGVAPPLTRLLEISHFDEALFVADGSDDPPRVRPRCRPPVVRTAT